MSASLTILIPVVLLGLVTALCFVGCVLNTHGLGPNLSAYEGSVYSNKNSIALWPLNDTAESLPTAANIVNPQFNGTYPDAPMGPNSFMIQQPGIVFGDVNNGLVPCAFFNGSFVTVDFHQELNPAKFTAEAWVKPNWTAADPQVVRVVLASANTTAGAGYALFATADNFWEAQIGTGSGNFLSVKFDQGIALNADKTMNPVNYLAMTFDGSVLTLFVGTVVGTVGGMVSGSLDSNSSPPLVAPTQFVPEQAMPSSTATPLFIGMGRPDMMGGMFPFNGSIQDVAFYSPPLSSTDVQNNFNLGSTPPG
jgi:hypothetical protein